MPLTLAEPIVLHDNLSWFTIFTLSSGTIMFTIRQDFLGKYLYINDSQFIGGPPTSSLHFTFLEIIAVPIWYLLFALPHPSPRTADQPGNPYKQTPIDLLSFLQAFGPKAWPCTIHARVMHQRPLALDQVLVRVVERRGYDWHPWVLVQVPGVECTFARV